MPPAVQTPTGTEPCRNPPPRSGCHADGDAVAIGAPIASGQEIEEKNGRGDPSKDEESTNDRDSKDRLEHSTPHRRFSTCSHSSTKASKTAWPSWKNGS